MKWIVITSPKFLQGEAHFIPRLFAHGVDLLHLRKPGASIEECSQLLDKIPQEWHNRIVLHSHFELASTYRLHGIHLNHRCPQAPEGFNKSISCSCHSLKEVVHNKPRMNYMFLSPIFDSISKEGYGCQSYTSLKRLAFWWRSLLGRHMEPHRRQGCGQLFRLFKPFA